MGVIAAALIALTSCASAPHQAGPAIEIGDVARFYQFYDAANGHPSAEVLQRDYIDAGSQGLRDFARLRRTTGARIAENVAANPAVYENARRCAETLPRVRERVRRAMGRLARLYPEAQFPPITIAIGRGRPTAIGSPATGVQVGLESLCAADFLNPDIEDRFVNVIAHEYTHVQQRPELADGENLTVLEASLMEGAAEFVAELTAGGVSNVSVRALSAGREREIETEFVADMDSRDVSHWLYNSMPPDKLGDLGYWVGYRIVRAYYQRATDKRAAIREILTLVPSDAHAFLAASGWSPGMSQ